jgi:hypothetical protein
MAEEVRVNGRIINYPETGDTNWGDEATEFAIQTSAAFGKLGLASGTSVDVAQTLDVTGNTTLDANLSVGGDASVTGNTTLTGNLSVNGNSTLGNGTSDTTAITGILNVDSGVLYVDPANNRVGINDTTPSVELDVNGSALISGTLGVTGATSLSSTLGVTGDVAVNTNKFNVTASSGNTTIAGTLGVSGNTTIDGVTYLDDNTTANTPVLSFTGDTNTGIGRSAADTLDFITNGNSRFRIEPTGQIKAVYESTIGSGYNTQLDNGYLCRAWVNFNGTATQRTGTYTISGTTITVNITSHGLSTGNFAQLDFSSGDGVDGRYSVTVINANSYTITNPVSGSTGGNVTQDAMIRASGNVSSITDNNTGDYTVNFTTAMPDINYCPLITTGVVYSTTWAGSSGLFVVNSTAAYQAPTVNSFRIGTRSTGGTVDFDNVMVAVLR